MVSESAQADIAQTEGLEQQTLTVSKFCILKSKTRMLAGLVLGEGSLLGLQMATFLHCVFMCKRLCTLQLYQSHWYLGKEPMASI